MMWNVVELFKLVFPLRALSREPAKPQAAQANVESCALIRLFFPRYA